VAVPQSTAPQLFVPMHVTLHATPGGHVTLMHFAEPGHAMTHVPPEHVPPVAGHAAAHAAAASASAVDVDPSGGGASPPPAASPGAIASPESSTPASPVPSPRVVRFGALTHAAIAAAPHARIDATTSCRTILRLSHVIRRRAGSSAVPPDAAATRSRAAAPAGRRTTARVPITHGARPKFTEAVREVAAPVETTSGKVAKFLHSRRLGGRASNDVTHVVHPTE
jgi:hypothetical protein